MKQRTKKQIRDMRKRLGWTQQEAQTHTGMSAGHILRMEGGDRPVNQTYAICLELWLRINEAE